MKKARNNHYVPQWYQKGFCSEGEDKLFQLKEKIISLPSGSEKKVTSTKLRTPAQCLYQKDLYSTFFGEEVNDEIETKLFGKVDDNGSSAIRAFLTDDQSEWTKHFEGFFSYLDAQKLRTPKGLDWLKGQYPRLSQNELMREMQAVRMMHCTLWAEGVREFVSAEDSDVKFIVSDHPITVYNYALPPRSDLCEYPNDPDTSLKGSQTIFPLDKNRCLILTNLEYAKDPENENPLEQRTNAVRIRQSMVNTIEFISTRKLTAKEVSTVNLIIKSRARESVSAGKKEWLNPELTVNCEWSEMRRVLLPPEVEIHRFGGEMYVKFKDGTVHYQDAFGQTEQQAEFLLKTIDENKIGRNDSCGCGSGKKYKKCCSGIDKKNRTTWVTLSIRERNLALCNAINHVLGIRDGKTWTDVRREISGEQIAEIFRFYSVLWPRDTDIYSLLPKPDDKFRALYTGPLDIRTIDDIALGVISQFDEFLIQCPLIYPNNIRPEYSPIENPDQYKYQALKDFMLILRLETLIGQGLINLIPDPSVFDLNLLHRKMEVATERSQSHEQMGPKDIALYFRLSTEDILNTTCMKPRDVKIRMLTEQFNMAQEIAEKIIDDIEAQSESAPLMLLQPAVDGEGGQFINFSMAPNFEMSLFLAQATSSTPVCTEYP